MKIEDYSKYYIQGSDHYLIPKEDFEKLYYEMENWKDEYKNLEEDFKEYKKNIEDNYKQISQEEQYEMYDRDFMEW